MVVSKAQRSASTMTRLQQRPYGCKRSSLSFNDDMARFKVKLHETFVSKDIVLLKPYNPLVLSIVVVQGLMSKPQCAQIA
jgi:hypothetical protein